MGQFPTLLPTTSAQMGKWYMLNMSCQRRLAEAIREKWQQVRHRPAFTHIFFNLAITQLSPGRRQRAVPAPIEGYQ
jgi:hypothetical protein